MILKKSQTATEYLIITAVVIILALVVVSFLGGIPGLGSGISEQQARLILQTQTIGVSSVSVSDYDSVFTLTNSHGSTVRIDSVSIDGEECVGISNVQIRTGQSRQVTCENIYSLDSSYYMQIVIDWTDVSNSASYTQSGDDLILIGSTASKYMSVLTANDHWNSTSGTGCFDASADPIPLCTCFDLNEVRNHLSDDFAVQNNIDFLRCNAMIGSHGWNSGAGWVPIGNNTGGGGFNSLQGTFDGQNKFIANLFIDRSTNHIGFFGSVGTGSEIKNIGLMNVDITGNNNVGGLFGYCIDCHVLKSFVTGVVVGEVYVGGLVGLGADIVDKSFFIGSVTGDTRVGGIMGHKYYPEVTNTYVGAQISGNSFVGGLVGFVGFADNGPGTYTASFWVNNSDSATACTGDDPSAATNGCTAVSSINEIPIR